MIYRIFAIFTALLILSPAQADERILDFHSDLQIYKNGKMRVTETIIVRAEGKQIKRGIYRDFPTKYKDRFGNNYEVEFKITSVKRDGYSEPWHTQKMANGVRLYIGDKNRYLEPDTYEYNLSYHTNRQLGFFDDHDEIYWNVTGNGWAFPIDHASATVQLPTQIATNDISMEAYTGSFRSQGRNFTAELDSDGFPFFEATHGLLPNEGLTIVAAWPRGYITRPDTRTRLQWFLKDNRSLLIGAGGTLLILVFYGYSWYRLGRDPEKGTIIPLYEPPEKISPAAARYILNMGFDDKTTAAAIINMAVKGYLKISGEKDDYSLELADASASSSLSQGEKALAQKLLKKGAHRIELKNTNHSSISTAVSALKTHLKAEYHQAFFHTNLPIILVGALLTLTVVLASGLLAASKKPDFLFLCLWLTMWTGAVITLWLRGIWIMAIPFTFFEIMAIGMFGQVTGYGIALLIVLLISINGLFYWLMKAPTRRGRKIMDHLEGFRMYLATAEADRLNLMHPPERTPELFERYLPYALALGVEQEWAEQFSDVLTRAQVNGRAYSPTWYHGNRWQHTGISTLGNLGSSLGGAISSSSHAPGSSSGGGGGGSSGGGGGGGGGGGW